jgi:hypothetical protein
MDSVSLACPVNGKRQGWILVAEFLFNQFVSNFLCRVKRIIKTEQQIVFTLLPYSVKLIFAWRLSNNQSGSVIFLMYAGRWGISCKKRPSIDTCY